jgi:hypothetical protein
MNVLRRSALFFVELKCLMASPTGTMSPISCFFFEEKSSWQNELEIARSASVTIQRLSVVDQLREKIERLQAELVEKSDDDMFTNFAMEIGYDKKRIEDKVADVVARYSKETQTQ